MSPRTARPSRRTDPAPVRRRALAPMGPIAIACALAFPLGLALAGCSNSPPPQPTTLGTRAEATVTVPGRTGPNPGAPSSATVDVLAEMPPAARERSDAGADAYVRYFYDAANRLVMNPRAGQIPMLCQADVPVCTQWERSLASYAERGVTHRRPIFHVTLTDAIKGAGDDPDGYLVTTMLDRTAQALRTPGVSADRTVPSRTGVTQVISLAWRDGRWFITRIQEMA